MSIRAFLVDDEVLARNRLRKFLALEPDVEIVGECDNGTEALAFIRERHPDLVFLDLHMPQFSGLDIARALPVDNRPAIVFVTAHDQHAVEAFEIRATDYLLKPISHSRLQETVRRVRQRLQAANPAVAVVAPLPEPSYLNRFAIKESNQTLFLKASDVNYIEAAANYVVLCTPQGNHILRETLRNLETTLSPASFLRISRAVIVNLDRVKAIRAGAPGEWLVVLHGGRELPMTRGLKEVQERLQYAGAAPSPADG